MSVKSAYVARNPYIFELTDIQKGFLQGLADGFTREELALKFSISQTTINRMLTETHEKLNTKNALQSVAAALRQGIIE